MARVTPVRWFRGLRRLRWSGPFLLSALGLWCSLGLLDVVTGNNGIVRVAMLPPWWLLGIFAITAIAAGFAAARSNLDPDIALPLCALALFAVPYLPWLPDRLPVLRVFAGPARGLLWIVVGWAFAVRACGAVRAKGPWINSPAVVFVLGAAIFGATAWRMTTTSNYPDGDEPHYLVMTQSLLRDGDLKIENNHQRGDYREYFGRTLRPDYLTRGVDGQIYSVHPVGLPVLAMPAFAIAGYPGVIGMLVLIAALAATLLWTRAREITGSPQAATFAWAAAALTAPFLFNSFTVFPEIPGALAVMIAFAWRAESVSLPVMFARGVALATLPWLSTKYAPMAAAVGVVVMLRARWNLKAIAVFLAPIVVSLAGWFAFFWHFWGTLSPSAPYGSQALMGLGLLVRGGQGLLLDQEYGLVTYAPVLLLAFVGAVQMLRTGGTQARRALEVIFVVAALLCIVGGYHVWWGGSGSPGRPMASAILLLGVPIASLFAALQSPTTHPSTRLMSHLLLGLSLALACWLVFAQDGALIRNDRDGTSSLLAWMSPTWPLSNAAPSFIVGSVASASARALAWLAVAAGVAILARRIRPQGAAAALAILVAAGGALLVATVAARGVVAPSPDARPRVPLLDHFDAGRRPNVWLYDPLSRIQPADVLARFTLLAKPGLRTLPQPVPLLWNARFALPAGEYRVRVTRRGETAAPTIVGLQIGRAGAPIESWDVAGAHFERTLVLPIDAAFVGLRAAADLAQSDGTLEITPVRVVNEHSRVSRPPVISTIRYGDTTVYFHDDVTAVDREGYWTAGRTTAHVTYAVAAASASTINVTLRCGPVTNHVKLSMPGWTERFDIAPGATRDIAIPAQAVTDLGVRIAPLDISVSNGFVPSAFDGASRDSRLLGCRVELGRAK